MPHSHGVLVARTPAWSPFPPPLGHVSSELLSTTRLTRVAVTSMALSVSEFLEALCHDKAVMLHHAASRAGTVSLPIQSNCVSLHSLSCSCHLIKIYQYYMKDFLPLLGHDRITGTGFTFYCQITGKLDRRYEARFSDIG